MTQPTEVTIKPAKGRPFLHWVGKQPLNRVLAYPAQLVERYGEADAPAGDLWQDWPDEYPRGGLIFHGDNKDVLAHLLANGFRGKVKLVYIDPPFDSGADYIRKVELRDKSITSKLIGENYTIGEQIQYSDIWTNDNFLQFMYERILLIRELIHIDGCIALHCDSKRNHYFRLLLDEVFGPQNFRGEIIVRTGTKNVQSQFDEVSNLNQGNNTIFLYSKGVDKKLPKLQAQLGDFIPGKWDTYWRGTDRPTMRYEIFGQIPQSGQWRWEETRSNQAIENYREYCEQYKDDLSLDDYYIWRKEEGKDLDFVRLSEDNVVQYYVPPRNYRLLSNVWLDIPYKGNETLYPTEKNQAIAYRLIQWLTKNGDLVMDCFVGSGTTVSVAQKTGRRWIACDINKGAIQTTAKRMNAIMSEKSGQHSLQSSTPAQLTLLESSDTKIPTEPESSQLGFAVYRVNDYDLQIQHNEAVNLAVEQLGITRLATDRFFDGALGKRLAKIIPFNHPLTPLDLEQVRQELSSRPEEDRDIVVVCLGKELAADAWLDEWNRNRQRGTVPNKIEAIELRTDARVGGFFAHRPAQAAVTVRREDDKLRIEITEFLSPTILERLQRQSGVLTPQVTDWRAMVDTVLIDPAYDGQVFNVALADVPARKQDFVQGSYALPAPAGPTVVAVKITDMLGEEVLVTAEV